MEKKTGQQILIELQKMEKIAMYIWIGIVGYQVIVGFFMASAWAFAAWNVFTVFSRYNFWKNMLQNHQGIYKHYEDELLSDIIFLVLNLCLGGVIAAVGAGYDLYIRSYAMKHREELLALEAEPVVPNIMNEKE